jgi:hypothetical protein
MPTRKNLKSLGTSSSPLVAKRNGPYPKLPSEVRVALLAAFYQERPEPKDLVTWCRAKAEEWDCRPEDLSGLVGNLTQFLEREVQIMLGGEAEKFAAAAGMTLTKTLKRLNQLLDARKTIQINMGAVDGNTLPQKIRWVPDNMVRGRAVETALTYFNRLDKAHHTVKHDHEHTHKHLIMNLSDEEVIAQIRELNRKTTRMLEATPLPPDPEPKPPAEE